MLRLFQLQGFIVEECRCWTGPPAVRYEWDNSPFPKVQQLTALSIFWYKWNIGLWDLQIIAFYLHSSLSPQKRHSNFGIKVELYQLHVATNGWDWHIWTELSVITYRKVFGNQCIVSRFGLIPTLLAFSLQSLPSSGTAVSCWSWPAFSAGLFIYPLRNYSVLISYLLLILPLNFKGLK